MQQRAIETSATIGSDQTRYTALSFLAQGYPGVALDRINPLSILILEATFSALKE